MVWFVLTTFSSVFHHTGMFHLIILFLYLKKRMVILLGRENILILRRVETTIIHDSCLFCVVSRSGFVNSVSDRGEKISQDGESTKLNNNFVSDRGKKIGQDGESTKLNNNAVSYRG